MSLPNETKVKQVRGLFEGRESIYVEKGALRVKVSDVRGDVARLFISAEVEEIPTAGFPAGAFYEIQRLEPSPMRWSIEGGYLTIFSDHTWHMGYGGRSPFFSPRLFDGILGRSLPVPDKVEPPQR